MLQKKSLGQHFLKAPAYVRAIVDAADVQKNEVVLEIGPGEGVLTRELLTRGARVIALEKDSRLIPILQDTFAQETQEGKLKIIEGDALAYEVVSLVPKNYKVVANIPYYITGALLRKFLTAQAQPSTLVFLVQKEVAERIVKSKKESLLSLSVKAYGDPSYIKTVPRGAFSPPPDVDSAILLVSDISRKRFKNKQHEESFFALIHAGFAQKRKLLRRNIENILGEKTLVSMEKAGINEKARAEDVPLEQWLRLSAAS